MGLLLRVDIFYDAAESRIKIFTSVPRGAVLALRVGGSEVPAACFSLTDHTLGTATTFLEQWQKIGDRALI